MDLMLDRTRLPRTAAERVLAGFAASLLASGLTCCAAAPQPPSLGPTGLETLRREPLRSPWPTPELREGTWSQAGHTTMLGAGCERRIEFRSSSDGWHATQTRICTDGFRDPDPPRTTSETHRVTVRGGVLAIHEANGPVRVSFDFDGDDLLLPAFVQLAPGAWLFVDERQERVPHSFFVELEGDPFESRTGRASFPGDEGDGYYVLEQDFLWKSAIPKRTLLRLLRPSFSDGLVEEFHLVLSETYSQRRAPTPVTRPSQATHVERRSWRWDHHAASHWQLLRAAEGSAD